MAAHDDANFGIGTLGAVRAGFRDSRYFHENISAGIHVQLACLLDRGRNDGDRFVEIISGVRHFTSSGAQVNIDDPDQPADKLLQLLRDNEIDVNVFEWLRLVVAFRKITDPSDRRVLIELAERLAK